jgi:hypothetical protein
MIETHEQLMDILRKKACEVSIELPESLMKPGTRYHWMTEGIQKPPEDVYILFGPAPWEYNHWFHLIAQKMNAREGREWGVSGNEDLIFEGKNRGERPKYWIAGSTGIRLFGMFLTFLTAWITRNKCLAVIGNKLPLPEMEVIRYWDTIYPKVIDNQQIYSQIMQEANVRMKGIAEVYLRPAENRRDIEAAFKRLEEEIRMELQEKGSLDRFSVDSKKMKKSTSSLKTEVVGWCPKCDTAFGNQNTRLIRCSKCGHLFDNPDR